MEFSSKRLIQGLNQFPQNAKIGRKSFPASAPICITDQLINRPLLEVMKSYPWQGRSEDIHPNSLRLLYEGEPRLDVPNCFNPRRFGSRNNSHILNIVYIFSTIQLFKIV